MNVQDAKNLTIPEGSVKMIHDNDNRLLWGAVGYNTKYTGNTAQATTTGKNLFNNSTITFPSEATLNPDGSITVVYDNTNGSSTHFTNLYTTPLNLQTSTEYAAFAEILSLTGGGTLAVIGGASGISQFTNNRTFNLANYATGDIIKAVDRTKSDFAGTTTSTRTYVGVQAGLKVNITFRMSLIIDTSVTPATFVYEPYTGGIPAPNPGYPQPINMVTGVQTVTVSDGALSKVFTVELGAAELCKIGTYQDYIYKSGGDWYVHKETGTTTDSVGSTGKTISDMVSNGSIFSYCGGTVSGTTITYDSALTVANTIYYQLVTATDTKITDNTLISQLNAVHEWLTRYGYNATVTGNLPIVISKTNL